MNVVFVAPSDDFGGVSSVVRNLTEYLRARRHSVRLICSGSSIFARKHVNSAGLSGVKLRLQAPFGERHPLVSLAAFFVLFPLGLFQLAWRLWRWRIRVVNIHYPADNLFYFALCRRFLRFTLVCSIHGGDLFPNGKRQTRYSRGMRLLLRYADSIVAPSEDHCRRFVSVFPEHRNKATFIHNGIELADCLLISQATPLNIDRRYILSVSAYKEQKALDVLVRAMRTVAARNPSVDLVLVGEGPLRGDLEALTVHLGLSHRIEFHGRKSHREVLELFRGCDVFVLPSRFETFGIALVEAMACGRAVVATNAGGMPEIVQHKVNGMLVEPDDPLELAGALNTLLTDTNLRRELGAAAFEHAHRHFSAASMGAAYERLFQLEGRRVQTDSVAVLAGRG